MNPGKNRKSFLGSFEGRKMDSTILKQRKQMRGSGALGEESTFEGLRALVIDDYECFRDMLSKLLGHLKIQVAAASSGQDGLVILQRAQTRGEKFDIVFTDLAMDQMDGLEVAKQVKSQAPEVIVVLVSGYTSESCDQPNIDAILNKPFFLSDLRQCLGCFYSEEA